MDWVSWIFSGSILTPGWLVQERMEKLEFGAREVGKQDILR